MGKKLLEIHLISAQDLKFSTRYGKPRAYAVAWVRPSRRLYTHVDEEGGSSPAWNEKLVMSVNDFLLQRDSPAKLNVDIFHRGHTHDRIIASVEIPLREIARDAKYAYGARSSEHQYVGYELRRPSGRLRGILNIAVRIRERSPSCSSSSSSSESDSERAPMPSEYPPRPAEYPPRSEEYPPHPADYPPRSGEYGAGIPYSTPPMVPPPPPSGYPSYGTGISYGAPLVPPPTPPLSYPQQQRSSSHTGLALGAGLAAGALGGLVLGEVVENMEERAAEDALENVGYGDDDGDFGGDSW